MCSHTPWPAPLQVFPMVDFHAAQLAGIVKPLGDAEDQREASGQGGVGEPLA